MRLALLFLPVFLLGCVSVQRVPPVPRPGEVQLKAAVMIMTDCIEEDPMGGISFGGGGTSSGVVISERHILTMAHAVTCKGTVFPQIRARLPDGRIFRMAIDKIDTSLDLARLQIASADRFRLSLPPPVLGKVPPAKEPVCVAAGYPRRGLNCGYVSEKDGGFDIGFVVLVVGGNSGAGIYDAEGRLVALVHGISKTALVPVGIGLEKRPEWVFGLRYAD